MPTPTQIVLAWTVDVSNTTLGPAGAAAKLLAVPLYQDPTTDPVLGQFFGLTVASDVSSTPSASTAMRTLTLNMDASHARKAPPPFPCNPRTATPPVLPYPLRKTVTLPGSFFPSNGSTVVPTTMTQLPSLSTGDGIQFLSQGGVFYTVAAGTTATQINLTAPYTGTTQNTGAFKETSNPVSIAAIFSTSDLDTAGVATTPAIPAGPGARTVAITYTDSTGATGRAATATLTGRRPAAIAFTNGNGIIAAIEGISIASVGSFGNSIGQLTLVELSAALPALPTNLPIGTGVGAAETTVGKVGAPVPRTFRTMTDDAQLLVSKALAYLPPSYFSLAQQGIAAPGLAGDFMVTTGAKDVPTTADQTGSLTAGNTLQFASQPGTLYTVAAVTPKVVTLTEAYSGIDDNFTGQNQVGTNANAGVMGNIGTAVSNKRTGAMTPVSAVPPSNTPLAQFVALETAQPPLNPPLSPQTVPTPTFLSGMFTRTLQLALAGVPITSATITFV
jgi:hypothetical protein